MSDVRAITVRQPWAWAIAHGGKTIENRSQGTSYRGLLLIHAGKAWSDRGERDPRVCAAAVRVYPSPKPPGLETTLEHIRSVVSPAVHATGVIAVAQLVDSHPDAGCCRPWGESTYVEHTNRVRRIVDVHHLVLEDVIALAEPVPCRGALGLWRPPEDVVRECGGITVGGA